MRVLLRLDDVRREEDVEDDVEVARVEEDVWSVLEEVDTMLTELEVCWTDEDEEGCVEDVVCTLEELETVLEMDELLVVDGGRERLLEDVDSATLEEVDCTTLEELDCPVLLDVGSGAGELLDEVVGVRLWELEIVKELDVTCNEALLDDVTTGTVPFV